MNEEFKLIIAGGRDFDDYTLVVREFFRIFNKDWQRDMDISIVSGMARGADTLAVSLAEELELKLYQFPANWDEHGKAAGFIRNKEMAEFADGLLAFWDGKSKGTKHMIDVMAAHDKMTRVIMYNQ